MINLELTMKNYLDYCYYQKKLDKKTIKAYSIDLKQFVNYVSQTNASLDKSTLSNFITFLHQSYKPKSAKRKIASLKAFFAYMEYEELIDSNPFSKMHIKFKEPFLLPRTIALHNLNMLFSAAYNNSLSSSNVDRNSAIRDVAVLELLFATGLRVSELCGLKSMDVDIQNGTVRVFGKGSKERIVQIANPNVLNALENYKNCFLQQINQSGFFFVNRCSNRLSEQSVRFMIYKYCDLANIHEHITPHMFRHTFATMLLEEDVDIRYIQQILGHSSIMTTQIYTHVTSSKQREILTCKHPRNKIEWGNEG